MHFFINVSDLDLKLTQVASQKFNFEFLIITSPRIPNEEQNFAKANSDEIRIYLRPKKRQVLINKLALSKSKIYEKIE